MQVKACVFIFFWVVSLIIPSESMGQCACTPTSAFPTTVNGITISLSNTGSVTNYGANWPSCGLSAGPMWAGSAGPFTQTYTFSQPVNNVNYVITAASGFESFSFSVGAGVLSTSQCGGTCPFTQVGNTFTCNGNDDGTTVVLSSTMPYTSITVTGPGGSNGSLVGLCVESIIICPTPTISISPASAICQGATRTLTVTGATSYTWSPAASLSTTSGSVVVASPATTTVYTVVAAGSGTCTASATTTVSVTPSPTVSISPATANICQGSSVGLVASGATSYSWTPATALSNTNTANVTASPGTTTTYTVIGSSGTCTNSATRTVSVTPIPTLTLTPSFTTICFGTSANLAAAGATTYTWSPATGLSNANAANVTASPASTTTYTVTGANGICTNTAAVTVSVVPMPTVTATPATVGICSGASTNLSASGAASYTWSPATGLNNANLATVVASPAVTTNYTLTGANGICTATALATVSVTPTPTLIVTPSFTTICSGISANLNASGATNYTWSPATGLNNANAASVVASPATTSTYTITGANGTCTNTAVTTLSVVPVPTVAVTPTLVGICSGSSTNLSASGATSYTWSPATGLNNANLATVVASPAVTTNYTVTGANGICTATALATVSVTPTPTLAVTPASTTICSGTSANFSVSGAANYTWSPATGLNNANAASVVASLAATSVYTITGANGICTGTAVTTVSVIPMPTVAVTPTMVGICSGASTNLSASGATSYTWSPATGLNNANLATVAASPATTTNYTVTGANGICTATALATVSVTPTPTLAVTPASTTICSGTSTNLSASGAASYTWSPATGLNNANAASVTASPATTTIYTVTGANGVCTKTAVATVSIAPVPSLTLSPASVNICPGTSTTLTATGATNYTWTPLSGLSTSSGSMVVASPAASTTYTITGLTGICSNTALATVNVQPSASVTLSPQASTICAGSSVTLTATGSTSYTWAPATGLSASNGSVVVSSPSVGTTVYTVTGGVGTCTAVSQVSVTVNALPSLTLTPATSSICAGFSATLSAAGASSYTWSPSASVTTGSLVTLAPLASTVYTVTGTINSCTASATTTLNVMPNPTLSIVPNTTVCAGTGTTLTVSGALTYSWNPSTGLSASTGSIVTSTPAATQTYTITGAQNTCTATAVTTVSVIPLPVIVMSPDPSICSGTAATLSASGASTYSWTPSTGLSSTSGGTVSASPGSSTGYTVTGTTAGCSSTGSVNVAVTPTPTLVTGAVPNSMCVGLSSSLSVSGAGSYTWSPSGSLSNVNLSNPTAKPVQTTTYTVIGANGLCTASATVEVIVIQTATVQASKFGDVCFGEYTTIEAIGGTTYNWLPVSGLSNANGASTRAAPLVTTVYTVTASAPGLCSSTSTVEVKVNPLPHVYAGRDTTINIDETITLTGTGDVEVGFLAPTATPLACNYCNQITVNPQEPTCYVLKGENGYGCVDFDTVCVYVTKDFDVFIPNAFTPNEDGYNDIFIPVGYGIEAIRLTVFDRWGVQIFTSYENNIGWDGSYKGKQCEQGVYTYKAEIKTMAGHTVQRVGHVTLLPKSMAR